MTERNPIWRITGFQSDGVPHWSVAYVEAPSDTEALAILIDHIVPDDSRPDTVWATTDPETWKVTPVDKPLLFVLGGGCR